MALVALGDSNSALGESRYVIPMLSQQEGLTECKIMVMNSQPLQL